jgi:hypothetical protein
MGYLIVNFLAMPHSYDKNDKLIIYYAADDSIFPHSVPPEA